MAVEGGFAQIIVLGPLVHVEIVLLGRPVLTLITGEGLFSRVRQLVAPQLVLLAESLSTLVTLVLLHMLDADVLISQCLVRKVVAAIFAVEESILLRDVLEVEVGLEAVHGEGLVGVAAGDGADELSRVGRPLPLRDLLRDPVALWLVVLDGALRRKPPTALGTFVRHQLRGQQCCMQ